MSLDRSQVARIITNISVGDTGLTFFLVDSPFDQVVSFRLVATMYNQDGKMTQVYHGPVRVVYPHYNEEDVMRLCFEEVQALSLKELKQAFKYQGKAVFSESVSRGPSIADWPSFDQELLKN